MIPLKLVETIFHRYWALALPIIVVPIIVLGLTSKPNQFQSTAVIWVSNPVASERPVLGANNPYLSPSQNQAQAVTDLLSTRAFRAEVAIAAGIIPPTADERTQRRAASLVRASAYSTGVNLVTVSAVSPSGKLSQAVVSGVISEYLERATVTLESDSKVAAQYYTQQLAVAQEAFNARSAQLAEYIGSNPRATDPTNPASQAIAYRTLVEQVSTQSALVQSLQQSLQAIQLRAASAPETQTSMFAVQDAPSLPENPLPVSMTSQYGMPLAGMMLGLCIGSAYLYVVYRTDHTVRSAEDLADLQVPLLGSVPQLQPAPLWARYTPIAWFLRWRRKDFARKTAASISNSRPLGAAQTPEVV